MLAHARGGPGYRLRENAVAHSPDMRVMPPGWARRGGEIRPKNERIPASGSSRKLRSRGGVLVAILAGGKGNRASMRESALKALIRSHPKSVSSMGRSNTCRCRNEVEVAIHNADDRRATRER